MIDSNGGGLYLIQHQTDVQRFIAYEGLNMESEEEYDLKFHLALYDDYGERFFGKSPWYKFKLTMP